MTKLCRRCKKEPILDKNKKRLCNFCLNTRKCSSCGKILSKENFEENKARCKDCDKIDELWTCFRCKNLIDKKHFHNNKKVCNFCIDKENNKTRICKTCKKVLLNSEFEYKMHSCKKCIENSDYKICKKCGEKKHKKLFSNSRGYCIECKEKINNIKKEKKQNSMQKVICSYCKEEIILQDSNRVKKIENYICKKCREIKKEKIKPIGSLVFCKICGKEYEFITSAHIKKCSNGKMTYNEYIKKHGREDIYSQYYKDKISQSYKLACTKEVREKLSKSSKKFWFDNKEEHSKKLKTSQNTKEAKQNHLNGFYIYRNKMTKEDLENESKRVSDSWKNEEIREKRINGINTPSSLLARSISGRKSWLSNVENGKFNLISSINIKIANELEKLNIEYIKEYICAYYSIDIAIPELKIAIECDGDYWHGNPKFYSNFTNRQKDRKGRDRARDTYLTNRGWIVLRFWEYDINNNFQSCIEKIILTIKEKT